MARSGQSFCLFEAATQRINFQLAESRASKLPKSFGAVLALVITSVHSCHYYCYCLVVAVALVVPLLSLYVAVMFICCYWRCVLLFSCSSLFKIFLLCQSFYFFKCLLNYVSFCCFCCCFLCCFEKNEPHLSKIWAVLPFCSLSEIQSFFSFLFFSEVQQCFFFIAIV